MSDERIVVEVKDTVDTSISSKLKAIAVDARSAHKGVTDLQKAINGLNVGKITTATQALNGNQTATTRLATAQQNLATAQLRTASAATQQATATANLQRAQDAATLTALRLQRAQELAAERARRAAEAQAAAGNAAGQSARQFDRAGLSVKQYNAAMRGVPAQITDIVVSLQGGQRPLTVLLQQGGQLKDMFGGIGPAFRALGTGLIAMIKPITLLVGSIVGFVAAVAMVESNLRTLNRLTAQFTASGRGDIDNTFISQLRKELMQLPDVSKSAATSIIQAFAEVRNVSSGTLKSASLMTADLATALGTDAPKAAEKLAEALRDPTKGALELDKALGFLTIQDLKSIDSMKKLGNTAGAQDLLLKRLKATIDGLALDSMTPLQKATNEVGNAWDRLLGSVGDSQPLKTAAGALATILNALAGIIDRLSNFKPPAWMQKMMDNGPNSWLGIQGFFGGKASNTGGATGSWGTANTGATSKATDYKAKAAGITGNKGEAESRAASLAKVNLQLKNELDLMGMLGKQREKAEMFARIEEQMAGKKIKLTADETKQIKDQIAAIVNGAGAAAERIRIYDEVNGAQESYNNTLKAAKSLLNADLITQQQYNIEMQKADNALLEATDHFLDYNKELSRSAELSLLVGDQLEIETKMLRVRDELLAKGIDIYAKGNEEYKTRYDELQKAYQVEQRHAQTQQAINQIYQDTQGQLKQLTTDVIALSYAHSQGWIAAEQYELRMNNLAIAQANLKLSTGMGTYEDATLASIGRLIEGYEGMLSGLSNSFGDFFVQLQDGFADSIGQAIVYSDDLGDALKDVARQAVSQLISSLVKLGVQYVINATIGQTVGATALATQTAASVAAAGVTAAAWAPAAAMVSLASFGANSAPAMAGITATTALTSASALMGLLGFEEGGYTGNIGTKQIAGVVHGKEFVVNASATEKYRPMLEAMNNGSSPAVIGSGSTVGKSDGPKVNLLVINNSKNSEVSTEETEDENGNVSLKVTVDNIENALAGRMSSGRGPLHKATGNAFGLAPKPSGG